MVDNKYLREYAENIFKGIRGYTLSKAFSLFPKYYPKIVFYYTELLTKQQNEFSLRMIQGLGIEKGRALLDELNILNVRVTKFYVETRFKLMESSRKIEAAADEDRRNVAQKEIPSELRVMIQSTHILRESTALLLKIRDTAKMYNFTGLEHEISVSLQVNKLANDELIKLNYKFYNTIKQSL